MSVTSEKKREFRAIGHKLKPVVMIADKGLTDGVIEEATRALDDHELIKVRIAVADRDMKKELIAELCSQCRAELIQTIGKVALIYKAAKEPNPRLSNVLRPH